MSVVANLYNGRKVELASPTISGLSDDLTASTAESLTGSAVPLSRVVIQAVDGTPVEFGDINILEEYDGDGRQLRSMLVPGTLNAFHRRASFGAQLPKEGR